MASNSALNLQQSPSVGGLTGFWKLSPDRAVSIVPGEAGVLRVTHGQVWVTLDGPHQGRANDWGDLVLRSGQQIKLMPGQHVVIESYADAVNEAAYFSWEPEEALPDEPSVAQGWQNVQATTPYVDARPWPVRGWAALGRMMSAIGRASEYLVAGRGQVLSRYESNQP